MNNEITVGTNRTGTALARERTESMIAGTEDFLPEGSAEPERIAAARAQYCTEAEPLGTIPPPTSFKGLAKTALGSINGAQPILFMDKLGERLAFEKGGVRLYETLLMKFDAYGSFPGGPERAELEEILEQEDEHHRLLLAAIESLAGDPTAVTPSADLAGVAASGIFSVLSDPRTGLLACLEAIVLAEMTDNEGWETLVALAEVAGEKALRETFLQARADEVDHLLSVRKWIAAGQGRQATATPARTRMSQSSRRQDAKTGVADAGQRTSPRREKDAVSFSRSGREAASRRKKAAKKKAPRKVKRARKSAPARKTSRRR